MNVGLRDGSMQPVLVVEDTQKWIEEVFQPGLRGGNYRAVFASSVDRAIELLETSEFAAVVVNLHLVVERDFFGGNVLAAVVRTNPLTPCILVTGHPTGYLSRTGRYQFQICELVSKVSDPKDFDLTTLFSALDRAIADRRSISELLAVLVEHLTEQECDQVGGMLIRHYHYRGFQPPSDLAGNTKKQHLGYMLAVLVSRFGVEELYLLFDLIATLCPQDRDLRNKINRIYPSANRPVRMPVDAASRAKIETLVHTSDLETAVDLLCGIPGYSMESLSLERRLSELELQILRGQMTVQDTVPTRTYIATEILVLIDALKVDEVRKLLLDAFTDVDLKSFCQDSAALRDVLVHFGRNFSFLDMVNAVIDYCTEENKLPELLREVHQHRSKWYREYVQRISGES